METASRTIQVSCVQLHWAKPLEENLEKTLHYMEKAAKEKSQVVLFPEAGLTGYYFPYAITLSSEQVENALQKVSKPAKQLKLWTIVGSIKKTSDKFLNLSHVISPAGAITYEYAKIHMTGKDEKTYCRGGNKLALFEIDGILCTLVICRDGRHPELYRIPAMAGAQILFHPSCSSDSIEAVAWKRLSGRAQQPVGPNTKIFHCVANTIGESPDGKQTSSGSSFIREPAGIPLAEAGYYQEEMITAVLDLGRATRRYALDSLQSPPFLTSHWEKMIADVKVHANDKPE